MKILLYGATDLGFVVASRLYQDHDISIIDEACSLPERFAALDVAYSVGSGADIAALERAEVAKSDIFIACSQLDEANVVACWTVKRISEVGTVCFVSKGELHATLSSPERHRYPTGYDIDTLIWPDQLLTEDVFRIVLVRDAVDVEYFDEGRIKLFEYRIKEDSPLKDVRVMEYPFPEDVLIVGITKDNVLSIPDGGTKIEVDDKIILMGVGQKLDMLAAELFQNEKKIQYVAVIGGGKVGYSLADKLETVGIKVKILEQDEARCRFLADNLKKSLVLCGDGTDLELLEEESLGDVDVAICVTDNDEKNLLCSLLIKQLGAGRVVTRVGNQHNANLFERVGVDVVVSPRESAMKELLNHIREEKLDILAMVGGGHGEILQIQVAETFRPSAIQDIKIPSGAIIGIIKRGRQILVPRGNTMVYPKDNLKIFSLAENYDSLKRLFEK